MRWLFAPPLRPLVLLAGAVSLVLNLALLAPAVYMLQVFDRVFASRSLETLAMLSLLAALALGLAYFMDAVRAGALAWAARALDRRLSPAALASVLHDAAAPGTRPGERLGRLGIGLYVDDFQAGAGSEDKLDLSAIAGLTFEWLKANAGMVDGNAVLDLGGGNEITLLGVHADSLHADDFLLA